jgi:hypothetical protein
MKRVRIPHTRQCTEVNTAYQTMHSILTTRPCTVLEFSLTDHEQGKNTAYMNMYGVSILPTSAGTELEYSQPEHVQS